MCALAIEVGNHEGMHLCRYHINSKQDPDRACDKKSMKIVIKAILIKEIYDVKGWSVQH